MLSRNTSSLNSGYLPPPQVRIYNTTNPLNVSRGFLKNFLLIFNHCIIVANVKNFTLFIFSTNRIINDFANAVKGIATIKPKFIHTQKINVGLFFIPVYQRVKLSKSNYRVHIFPFYFGVPPLYHSSTPFARAFLYYFLQNRLSNSFGVQVIAISKSSRLYPLAT